MKQLILTIIVLGIIGGGGYSYLVHVEKTSRTRGYNHALQELQRQFTERLGPIRTIEDTRLYEREISALLSWYFGELQKTRNQFPGFGDPNRVLNEFQEQKEAGRMSVQDFEQYKEHFGYVMWIYEQLERGDYGLVVTGISSNLRLDIFDLDRDRFENESRIRADFVLWGAPRIIKDDEERAGVTIRSISVPVRFTRLFFQFLNERGHVHGEMSGAGGEPYLKIVHPERWIPEFPPMAVLGRYWIDLFPDEAQQFVWEMDLHTTTTSGNRVESKYSWLLDIPRSWQVGGDWGGTETTRDRGYIERTNQN